MSHAHEPEQVSLLVAGPGLMHVGGEEREVTAGDLVHIPFGTDHGIENTVDAVLEYVSAATPAVDRGGIEAVYGGPIGRVTSGVTTDR